MTSNAHDQQPLRLDLDEDQIEVITLLIDQLPVGFTGIHCAPARQLLDRGIDDLGAASGVSLEAIQRLERGAYLNAVSMQALAFAFDAEGLLFFLGHPPLRGENCRGFSKDPPSRHDYHLLEQQNMLSVSAWGIGRRGVTFRHRTTRDLRRQRRKTAIG